MWHSWLRQAGAMLICFVVISGETQLWPGHARTSSFVKTEIRSPNFECIDVFNYSMNINSAGFLRFESGSQLNRNWPITDKPHKLLPTWANICIVYLLDICWLESSFQWKWGYINSQPCGDFVCWSLPIIFDKEFNRNFLVAHNITYLPLRNEDISPQLTLRMFASGVKKISSDEKSESESKNHKRAQGNNGLSYCKVNSIKRVQYSFICFLYLAQVLV